MGRRKQGGTWVGENRGNRGRREQGGTVVVENWGDRGRGEQGLGLGRTGVGGNRGLFPIW